MESKELGVVCRSGGDGLLGGSPTYRCATLEKDITSLRFAGVGVGFEAGVGVADDVTLAAAEMESEVFGAADVA